MTYAAQVVQSLRDIDALSRIAAETGRGIDAALALHNRSIEHALHSRAHSRRARHILQSIRAERPSLALNTSVVWPL